MDFFALFLPGERRPAPHAGEAAVLAARARVEDRLGRAQARLDGLAALLETADGRDAALVATLLAEDLDAAGADLEPDAPLPATLDRGGLGPLPGPEALAAFAGRAEKRLLGLRSVFSRRLARDWRTPADRFQARAVGRARAVLIAAVVLVAGGILFGDAMARKNREFAARIALEEKRMQAADALADLAKLASRAKRATGKPLFEITGRNCTRCGCEGRDLRDAPAGDVCVRQWDAALARIGQAAGASDKALARLARDPFGAPYLLNENEAESPDLPCVPDTFDSAGQNGLAGDGDDIAVAVPNAWCAK